MILRTELSQRDVQAPKEGLSRRDVVAGLLLLPVLGSVAGCASRRPDDPHGDLREALRELRHFLDERAANPAEAERFRAISKAIEADAQALLDEVMAFRAKFESALSERDVSEVTLHRQIEVHLERRSRIRHALLEDQEQLKHAVGRAGWDELVAHLNRGAEELIQAKRKG